MPSPRISYCVQRPTTSSQQLGPRLKAQDQEGQAKSQGQHYIPYFHTGPEGPELDGLHKGIQRVHALSNTKEITPTLLLVATFKARRKKGG